MRFGPALLLALLIAAAPSVTLGQKAQIPPVPALRGPVQPAAAGPAQPGAAPADPNAPPAGPNAPPAPTPLQSPSPYALPTLARPSATPPLIIQDQFQAQCSARCSRDYYFCLSGSNPEFCPSTWSDCATACSIAARKGG